MEESAVDVDKRRRRRGGKDERRVPMFMRVERRGFGVGVHEDYESLV